MSRRSPQKYKSDAKVTKPNQPKKVCKYSKVLTNKLSYMQKHQMNLEKVAQIEKDRKNGIIVQPEKTKDVRKLTRFTHRPFSDLVELEEDELRRICDGFGISGDGSRFELVGILVPFWPKPLSLKKDLNSISVKDLSTICAKHNANTKGKSKTQLANMIMELQKTGKITPKEDSSDDE